jgi:hypothetical protein
MPDLDRTTYEKAYARALAYLRRRTWQEGNDVAEQLAADALASSFDPKGYPWKRDKPLEHHVVNVARQLLADRRRRQKKREDEVNAATVEASTMRPAIPADARVRAADQKAIKDDYDRAMLSRLAGMPRDVFLLYCKDVFDTRQQANILGKTHEQIAKARKRVAEVARELQAEMSEEPESAPEMVSTVSAHDDYDEEDDEAAS